MLVIKVLGPHECGMAGGRQRLPNKALGLLSYLAAHNGQPVRRDRLADLLWPHQGTEQGRHSLRNCLLQIRKADPGWVESEYRTCRLGSTVTSDIGRFTALHTSTDRAVLAEACALYRGPFFDGIEMKSQAWDDWVRAKRFELAELATAAWWRLCDLSAADGLAAAAIAAAKEVVKIDPFNEPAHRRLMAVLADDGRRSEALALYHGLSKTLRRELRVRPDAETEALARRLAHSDRPVSKVSTVSTVSTAPTVPRADPEPRNWKRELERVANVMRAALARHTKLTRQLVAEFADTLEAAAAAYPEAHPYLEAPAGEVMMICGTGNLSAA